MYNKLLKIILLPVIFIFTAQINYVPVAADEKEVSIGTVEDGVHIFDLNDKKGKAWELHGKSAKFLDDGFVEVENINVIMYTDSSDSDKVEINSPSAQINQGTKQVRTDKNVTITSKDMIITGEGLTGNMKDKEVQIKNNVRVVITGENKLFIFDDISNTNEIKEKDNTDANKI